MTKKETTANLSLRERTAHINQDTNPLGESGILGELGISNAIPKRTPLSGQSVTIEKGKIKIYHKNGLNHKEVKILFYLVKKANFPQKMQILKNIQIQAVGDGYNRTS